MLPLGRVRFGRCRSGLGRYPQWLAEQRASNPSGLWQWPRTAGHLGSAGASRPKGADRLATLEKILSR
jgi:hypothetical protein